MNRDAAAPTLRVAVDGDVTVDWNIARTRGPRPGAGGWNAEDSIRAAAQPGGAALLGSLVRSVAANVGGGSNAVEAASLLEGGVLPGDRRFHHSYAIWSEAEGAWRVEEFLGLEPAAEPPPLDRRAGPAELVVLDDAALGFRDERDRWPQALDDGRWVLLKMARPVAAGGLWDELVRRPSRLVVVMTIADLRLSDVQITRELSWERIAQDLVWELVHNPAVNALSACAHVVVSLGTGGALLLSSSGSGAPVARLVFDPGSIEDSWARGHAGAMVGYTTCLTAAVAAAIMRDPEAPDVELGVQRGLSGMRMLHRDGYLYDEGEGLRFPLEPVAAEVVAVDRPFAVTDVPDPASAAADGTSEPWTILRDRHSSGLDQLARRVLLEGPDEALDGVPIGRFGHLLTVDRREIEGFQSIATLIREYSRNPRPKRPLSVAVFGPPGSGKSFGVIQVATSVLPGRVEVLEFNLSQMNDPHGLIDALHRVRDSALGGKLPLVFWDEFDTSLSGQRLGWLRHFLAPMQDGAFREGQVVHPIGPAVFVFAGGTSERMASFGNPVTDEFRSAKGPDFASRLKGYVDILGPDPSREFPDPYFPLRRAILLRSMLSRDAKHIFRSVEGRQVLQMDPGVVRAFLQVGGYRHGARSMESIVSMSTLSDATRFERSALPAEPQLELHTDARAFLALVQRLELEGTVLERLAEAAHVVYCEGMLADGHEWADQDRGYITRHPTLARFAETIAGSPPHPSLVPYASLPEQRKEQNRDMVRDIPTKLASAGLLMRPARDGAAPADLSDEEVERLAEEEHERWMRSKLAAGWRYGPERDDARTLHPDIVPWSKMSDEDRAARYGGLVDRIGVDGLPESQRERDRDLVRGIPRILGVAGYTLARTRRP